MAERPTMPNGGLIDRNDYNGSQLGGFDGSIVNLTAAGTHYTITGGFVVQPSLGFDVSVGNRMKRTGALGTQRVMLNATIAGFVGNASDLYSFTWLKNGLTALNQYYFMANNFYVFGQIPITLDTAVNDYFEVQVANQSAHALDTFVLETFYSQALMVRS